MNIVIAQKNFTVGDLKGNADIIIKTIENNINKDLIIFSELCVSGYPPLDLLDSAQFIEDNKKTLEYILKKTRNYDIHFIIGVLTKNYLVGKSLHNTLVVCHKGSIKFRYHKKLLPTYDIFDEDRYFEKGDIPPFFTLFGSRICCAICEDLWDNDRYGIKPINDIARYNPDFIISINASPSIIGKHEERLRLIQEKAINYGLNIIYANQVGSNDDVVFDGNSFYMDKYGNVLQHAKSFQEDEIIINDFLYQKQSQERSQADVFLKGDQKRFFNDNAKFLCEQAILGIKDYVSKAGFKKVVIGESGGIDSAVATTIAAKAIGPENVIAVTMPSKYSSKGSVEDSKKLCDKLGVKLLTIPIIDQYETFMKIFNTEYGYSDIGVTEQNVQARIRGQILMAISNREGALVISTGNKSELSVGFTTIYGDMAGGINPIADCYKMEVYAMGRYLGVPDVIIDKKPSAELADGQVDEDNLPPYPELDTILRYFIEGENEEEAKKALDSISKIGWGGNRIYRMLRNAEFKRRQAAVGIKMHKKAFGFGRRYPIINKYINK